MSDKPSYLNYDNKEYYWKPDIDYRKNPELYKVGKGEQGVMQITKAESNVQYKNLKSEWKNKYS